MPVGINYDGTIAFAGNQISDICFGYNWEAARVSIDPAKPGSYLLCNNGTFQSEVLFNTTVLPFHNSLRAIWMKVNQTTLNAFPNVFYFDAFTKLNAFGRLQKENYTIFGKVFYRTYTPKDGFHGWNPVTNQYFQLAPADEFEVLCRIP